MTIEEIYYSKYISARSLNICNDNNLKDLNAIVKYYQEHKTFGNLKNCGEKINRELIKLCLKYSNGDILYFNKKEISQIVQNLSDIQIEAINNAIINYCKGLSFSSKKVIKFLLRGNFDIRNINEKMLSNKHFDIYKLRYIGKKSVPEILRFMESIKKELFQNSNLTIKETVDDNKLSKPENPISSIISNFNKRQTEIIDSFIEINLNKLSNRSNNAIRSFLNENLTIRNINEKILTNDSFLFQDIKNVGTKSVQELNSFMNALKKCIEKVTSIENEKELTVLKNRYLFEKTFFISEIPNEILETQSFFECIDFLFSPDEINTSSSFNSEYSILDEEPNWQIIKKNRYERKRVNALFDKKRSFIFFNSFKIYKGQQLLSLDEIGQRLTISKERVRQLKTECLENLFNQLLFIQNIDDDLFQKYGIDTNQDFIPIDEEVIKRINEINNTNFSKEFITYLIYVYLYNKFTLIGNIEDVMQNKNYHSKNRHNWSGFYVVNRKVSDAFDFTVFIDDIYRRLNNRIEERYTLNIHSYLLNFLKNENTAMVSIIYPIAKIMINQEFNNIIDSNDTIVFKINAVKKVSKIVIKSLETLGIPSEIKEIYTLIENEFPEITISKYTLKATLKRSPEIMYFVKSKTYGLKKWELKEEE